MSNLRNTNGWIVTYAKRLTERGRVVYAQLATPYTTACSCAMSAYIYSATKYMSDLTGLIVLPEFRDYLREGEKKRNFINRLLSNSAVIISNTSYFKRKVLTMMRRRV
jgi:hypothetical protein